jgi:hypothetical protein
MSTWVIIKWFRVATMSLYIRVASPHANVDLSFALNKVKHCTSTLGYMTCVCDVYVATSIGHAHFGCDAL